MVAKRVGLFLEGGLWSLCIVNNGHVITIHGAIKRNPHHMCSVAWTSGGLHGYLERYKFCTKGRAFNSGLFLGVPNNGCHIETYEKSCYGSHNDCISCVIWVKKHHDVNIIPSGGRSIARDSFFSCCVEVFSTIFFKRRYVNFRVCGIKNQP